MSDRKKIKYKTNRILFYSASIIYFLLNTQVGYI